MATSLIVLDPGHGGHDPGAVGHGVQEKDVVTADATHVWGGPRSNWDAQFYRAAHDGTGDGTLASFGTWSALCAAATDGAGTLFIGGLRFDGTTQEIVSGPGDGSGSTTTLGAPAGGWKGIRGLIYHDDGTAPKLYVADNVLGKVFKMDPDDTTGASIEEVVTLAGVAGLCLGA